MPDIYKLAQAQRDLIMAGDKAAKDRLIAAYAVVDKDLQARLSALTDLIETRKANGGEINQSWLQKQARFENLLIQVEQQHRALAYETVDETTKSVQTNLKSGWRDASILSGAERPANTPAITTAFDKLPTSATQNMAAYLDPSSPFGKLMARITMEMPKEAVERAKNTLLVGVSTGQPPIVVAHNFRAVTGQSLTRSLTIARTEGLRAYRQAGLQAYQENETVTGWQWLGTKSARSCIACVAQDGKIYEKDAPFPSHVRCRCTTVPIVLGQIKERETAEDWLKNQDEATQDSMMGKSAASEWRSGKVELRDFVGERDHPAYGPSVFHDSLKNALIKAENRKASGETYSIPSKIKDFVDAVRNKISGKAVIDDKPSVPNGNSLVSYIMVKRDQEYDAVRDAILATQNVHGIGTADPARIPITLKDAPILQGDATGGYHPTGIQISKFSEFPATITLHEVGHYLDAQVIGQSGKFASETNPKLFKNFSDAVQSSKGIAQLRALKDNEATKHIDTDYLLANKELWARAYMQYIAVKSGDIGLQAELNDVRNELYGQWDDDDFAPIAKAIDNLMRELKWIK